MTIDKAIEILTDFTSDAEIFSTEDLIDACNLGTEALKAWERIRIEATSQHLWKLPGETKD